MTTKSIEAYKKLRPKDYDQFIQSAGLSHAEALDSLCLMVRVAPLSILELGTGTGLLTQRLLSRHPAARVTGVDGSSEMLALAEKKLAGFGARFAGVCSAFESCAWNRLAGGPFDLIVSSFALHHMDHARYPAFFAAMRRILKPGGQLLVADYIRSPSDRLQRHYEDIWVEARMRQMNERFGRSQTKEEVWRDHERNKQEEGDNPAPLPELIRWLRAAGYEEVETHWRCFCLAIYGGVTPSI